MDQISRRLKDEYGCKSIEQAEKLLEKLEKEELDAAKELEDAEREFREKYGERLDQ